MSIFGRISDIIAVNFNALLDKAEDPEKMISQIIREMESGLQRAKQQGAGAIAMERRLGRELEEHRARSAFWRQRARQALESHREDLARSALARCLEHEDLVNGLARQHCRAVQSSAAVRTTIRALRARLAEAQRKERSLVARNRAVRAGREARRFLSAEPIGFNSSASQLTKWELKIERLEDELAADAELDQLDSSIDRETAESERASAVEEQLQSLKNELNSLAASE